MSIEAEYTIAGMDCAECAITIEKGVGKLNGVDAVQVDFASGLLKIKGTVAPTAISQRVTALGYQVVSNPNTQTDSPTSMPAPTDDAGLVRFWRYLKNRAEMQYVFVGLLLVLLGLPAQFSAPRVTETLFMIGVAIAVSPTLVQGLKTFWITRDFNINLLMGIAVVSTLVIGEYFEGLLVIVLYNVGEAMEGFAADGARDSLRNLRNLTPQSATRLVFGVEETVPTHTLKIGDILLVKPHEMIPMDGVIVQGNSALNQAPITGESIPVDKTIDDDVFAGTINGQGLLHIKVTKIAEDNTLNRLIQLVEEAESERAPTQRVVENFARYYTPLVFGLAVLIAAVPPLLFGEPFWVDVQHSSSTEIGFHAPDFANKGWLYRALILLVIACPCSLVLSAPITVISSIATAARRGILIKGGRHLENLGRIKAIAFDKTGTLTQGRPQVTAIHALNHDEDALLKLASIIEKHSNHPIAQAISRAAQERNLLDENISAENVEVLVGAGVRGDLNGQTITIASYRYFQKEFSVPTELVNLAEKAENEGQTTLLLHDGQTVRGLMTCADAIRAESTDVVQYCHQNHIQTVMLTGDNQVVGQNIGQTVGVKHIQSELLPADKLQAITELTSEYSSVAMVGDGVNDAPALAKATVGIAVGGAGNAQAVETADVVLLSDGLKQLPLAIRISRLARFLITQNILLSVGTKLLFVLLAIAGMATLWMAIVADVGVLILVGLNGMRPLRIK